MDLDDMLMYYIPTRLIAEVHVYMAIKHANKYFWLDFMGRVDHKKLPSVITFHSNKQIHEILWNRRCNVFRYGDSPSHICYDETGNKALEVWTDGDGRWHRVGAPAKLTYAHGHLQSEKWYDRGILDRRDYPAHIEYNDDGDVIYRAWYSYYVRIKEDFVK